MTIIRLHLLAAGQGWKMDRMPKDTQVARREKHRTGENTLVAGMIYQERQDIHVVEIIHGEMEGTHAPPIEAINHQSGDIQIEMIHCRLARDIYPIVVVI